MTTRLNASGSSNKAWIDLDPLLQTLGILHLQSPLLLGTRLVHGDSLPQDLTALDYQASRVRYREVGGVVRVLLTSRIPLGARIWNQSPHCQVSSSLQEIL